MSKSSCKPGSDSYFMQRCIELAKMGIGTARPNPSVGCVIVSNGEIIGEGFTSAYGGNHAEVNAINSVRVPQNLTKATLYVTLEPCSHYGKTPPCSNLIASSGIKRVVIGCKDPNPQVSGKGIAYLQSQGIAVQTGIMEAECRSHHKRFLTFQEKNRPFIILKWAQSSDGFIAPLSKENRAPVWITNKLSRQLVHKWRTEEQAILAGTNTIQQDNPMLTARDWKGNNPIRIVIDLNNILEKDLNIFNEEAETLLITRNDLSDPEDIPGSICRICYDNEISSLIVEGGAITLNSFIESGLWDEARVFTAKVRFNEGIKAPEFNHKPCEESQLGEDQLKIYIND